MICANCGRDFQPRKPGRPQKCCPGGRCYKELRRKGHARATAFVRRRITAAVHTPKSVPTFGEIACQIGARLCPDPAAEIARLETVVADSVELRIPREEYEMARHNKARVLGVKIAGDVCYLGGGGARHAEYSTEGT
jgi:hypothetical protein